jgi:competence protein ComEC
VRQRSASTARADAAAAGADEPLDLRLVLPAAAAWLTAAVVSLWSPDLVLVSAGAALVGGVGGLVVALTSRAAGVSRVARVVAVCGLAAAAAAAAVGVRADTRTAEPVAGLARARAAVVTELVVTGDPRRVPGSVLGAGRRADLIVVPARLVGVTAHGRSWRVRQPVVVFAPAATSPTSAARPTWAALLPSQPVRAAGRMQPPRRGDPTAAVLVVRSGPQLRGAPSRLQRVAGDLRTGLREAAGGLPPAERGLLPGLVDGDTSGLDPELKEQFRLAGLSHLTAVSGTNVAIVLGAAFAVARRGRLGPAGQTVWALTVLAGFVLLARPSPSVLRAAVMGTLGVLAAAAGRPRAALPFLAAAVLVLVLLDPALAAAPGFALSVLATSGLVVLAPRWRDALAGRLPRWWAEALAVPLAAQVACAPVIAALGGGVSLVAVPANLLAVPAVAPATVLGVLTAAVAVLSPELARLLAELAGLPCRWLVVIARTAAAAPGAQLTWPGGLAGGLALAGVLGTGAVLVLRPRWRRRLVAVLVGGAVSQLLVVTVVTPGWPPAGWRLVACDVGQGDAVVLRGADRRAGDVLVDAGPDPDKLRGCLEQVGVRRLALVVLSHLHADHTEGLRAVLGRLPVAELELPPLLEPIEEWRRVQAWTTAAGVPVRPARVGASRTVAGLVETVLAPAEVLRGTSSDPNNASLVGRWQLPGLSVLLTGCVEVAAQGRLLSDGVDVRADVLKVPHHGSERQEERLLAAVAARAALVSVGRDNPYGHPSPRTLAALSRVGSPVFRTDRSGALAVVVGAGGRLSVVARRGRSPPG